MKRAFCIRRIWVQLCALGLLAGAHVASAGSHYTDLRNIEPIQGDAAAGAKKATVCFACHGAEGTSVAPIFPRLAGQRIDYLYHRLLTFKRADAKDPYYSKSPMTPLVTPLTEVDMRDLAAFFASQEPRPATETTAAVPQEKGEQVFRAGDPTRGIPPCQGCHGAEARGPSITTGTYAVYPVLRGQYSPYVVSRLTSFRNGLPHVTTSDFIMNGVAHTLDDDSIQAIAAWLGSLTPAKSL